MEAMRLQSSQMFKHRDWFKDSKRLQARRYNTTRLKALELFVVLRTINISSLAGRKAMLEISIMAGDLPREQNIFHARARSDVVNNEVALRRFVPDVCNDADVIDTAT